MAKLVLQTLFDEESRDFLVQAAQASGKNATIDEWGFVNIAGLSVEEAQAAVSWVQQHTDGAVISDIRPEGK